MDDPREPLTDIADILKVDVCRTSPEERVAMVRRYGPWRCRLLAEKVETREEFVAAQKAGFLYFQVYFFRKREILKMHDIAGNRLNYVRMLQAVSKPSSIRAKSRRLSSAKPRCATACCAT